MADISVFDRIVVVDSQIENKRDTNHINSVLGGTGSSGESAQQRSQEFKAMGSTVVAVAFKLWKTGSPTDNLIVTITASPGGASLGSKSIASSSLTAGALNTFTLDTPATVTPGTNYYAEVSRSGTRDTSNYWSIYLDLSTYMYPQDIWIKNNGSWSLDATTSDYHFIIYLRGNPQEEVNSFISKSESITVTESETPQIVINGSTSDSIAVTESVSVAATIGDIAPSETITVTESTSLAIPVVVSVSDSITISESIGQAIVLAFSLSETITITEAITLLPLSSISVSDSITVTESTSFIFVSTISVSDSISVSEDALQIGTSIVWTPRTDLDASWQRTKREGLPPIYIKE